MLLFLAATGIPYAIFVPTEIPLTGQKKALGKQGFTEVDFEVSNTALGSVLGVTFIAIFCVSLCIADGPKVKEDMKIAMDNIRSRIG